LLSKNNIYNIATLFQLLYNISKSSIMHSKILNYCSDCTEDPPCNTSRMKISEHFNLRVREFFIVYFCPPFLTLWTRNWM